MATSYWLSLAKINPECETQLKAVLAGAFPSDLSILELREFLVAHKRAYNESQDPNASAGVHEKDLKIPVWDCAEITLRIHSLETLTEGGSPLVVFLHGSGFCMGDLDSETLNARNFIKQLGAVVVNGGYRFAPEWPFPTAINDCCDAVKWSQAAVDAASLNADPSKGFVLGGSSAGGSMTAVIGLLARDEKLSPPLTGLCILVPVLLDSRAISEKYKHVIKSYEQNRDAPVLNEKITVLFLGGYKPDGKSRLYSAFIVDTFSNLPPVFLQVCRMDPLRDDALLFERLLRTENNVKTKLQVYPGVTHSFWNLFPTMQISTQFVEDTTEGMKWLLEQRTEVV